MNWRRAGYWTTTGTLAFFVGSGGVAELIRVPATIEGVEALGYPAYFVTIIGVWKVLGSVALLAQGFRG
jgi:DoxX-like protein